MAGNIQWPSKSREMHSHHFDSTMWNDFPFRDVVWSLHNHHANANDLWYQAINDSPGRVGPPIARPTPDLRQYWLDWFNGDGYPFWPFWENVRSWWAVRQLPNVLLVHFNDLKRDMPGQMRRIAQFLDIRIDASKWLQIEEYCSFAWMKRNATKSVPLGGAFWEGGAQTFVHKGSNRRWSQTLTAADTAKYEAKALQELGPECARWLAEGSAISA